PSGGLPIAGNYILGSSVAPHSPNICESCDEGLKCLDIDQIPNLGPDCFDCRDCGDMIGRPPDEMYATVPIIGENNCDAESLSGYPDQECNEQIVCYDDPGEGCGTASDTVKFLSTGRTYGACPQPFQPWLSLRRGDPYFDTGIDEIQSDGCTW